MKFFLFLFLIFFSFVTCEKKEKKEAYDPDLLYGLYITRILPVQNRINSCKVPNSVSRCGSTSRNCACTADKVEQGLLFDVNTSQYITSEKLTTPTTLSCLCPNKAIPRITMWSKGTVLNLESFLPNASIEPVNNGLTANFDLNTSASPTGTNFFCIVQCVINEEFRYQIVKLRSNQ